MNAANANAQNLPEMAKNGTDRLIVRLMEKKDLEDLRVLHNADETLMRLSDIQHVSEAQQEAWFQSVSISRTSKRYVARDRATNAFVGMFRIDGIDLINRNCLVGCDIVPGARGQGFATEFFGYILDYLFNQWGLHRVELVTLHDNAPAISLYKKLGFIDEGQRRDSIFRNGRYQNLIAMGLLDTEWRKAREVLKA